jgi:tetratricopeptide (TPR) repeat protein
MDLLICRNCGQTYNPQYMLYCARCGEPVPDEHGKLPKPGPLDGFGSRGGTSTRKHQRSPQSPESETVSAAPAEDHWQPTHAVADIVLEARNRLNQSPQDHGTRYSLGLAYLYAEQWADAQRELAMVAEALPDFADAPARLAICLARLGQLPAALEAAQRALALHPANHRYQALVEQLQKAQSHGI